MGKRGPQPLGNEVDLFATISPALSAGLIRAADTFDVSQATIVRFAIAEFLSASGVLAPGAEPIVLTKPAKHMRRHHIEGENH